MWGSQTQKNGAPKGGAPKGGPPKPRKMWLPKGGENKISRFFFPSPATIFALFVSLWVSSRGILVVFEARGLRKHHKIQRVDPERQKERKIVRERAKIERKFGRYCAGVRRRVVRRKGEPEGPEPTTTPTITPTPNTQQRNTTHNKTSQKWIGQMGWPKMDWPKMVWPKSAITNTMRRTQRGEHNRMNTTGGTQQKIFA